NVGVRVDQVAANSPAETAGLKGGDLVVKLNGKEMTRASQLNDVLSDKRPGDTLAFVVRREGKDVEITARLSGGERGGAGGQRGGRGGGGGGGGGGFRAGGEGPAATGPWKKDVFRVAVVGIEFPDVKHNPKASLKDWEDAFFSRNSFSGKASATGQ